MSAPPRNSAEHDYSSIAIDSSCVRRRLVAELIAETSDRFDLVRALAELLADRGDVDVDRAVEDVGVAAEGGVDDVVARQHAAGLARQQVKDAELGGRQRDRLAV